MASSLAREQSGLRSTVPLWINGEEQLASNTFEVFSSSLNDICWNAAAADRDDVLRAIDAASEAFKLWSKTKPAYRADILLKAADVMEANVQEYATYMTTEMGAERHVAQFFVLPLAIRMLKDIAGRISTICGSVPVCQQDGQSCMVYKEPCGVTLGIVPWNAPYVFGVRSAAAAIATGNKAILKASEMTPRCYWAIGEAFHEAGLPKGVLNILSCQPSQAAEIVRIMIEHPAVRKINFTGSAAVGRKVARACGENLKSRLMELGGKNSAIVLEDADIELAAPACIAGSFLNAGQICMGTDRIIVQHTIQDRFIEVLKEILTKSGIGVKAIADGAAIVSGGDGKETLPGAAFIPTVLAGVDESTEIWSEKTFGPVAVLAPVDSEDEAVSLANSTCYGLSASVFTHDHRKGLAIAKGLETGAVHINSMTIHDEPSIPFGGVKNSGWGRFNSEQGMEEFLFTKSVTWDD